MSGQAQFKVGAFAAIKNRFDKFLCVHRTDMDIWAMPGGKVEAGESPWDAVVREVKEETGLKVEVERLVGVYFKPEKEEIIFAFQCLRVWGKLQTSGESDKIEYFSFDDIPQNFAPRQRERIEDSLKNKPEAFFRIQKGPTSSQYVELLKKRGII